MKCIKEIALILIFISMHSCETDVDANDLLNKQELVIINGYLSPQEEVLKVNVSKSTSIISNTFGVIIEDAMVVLSDEENNEVMLTYSDTSLSYESPASNLAITGGKKYFLSVVAKGNEYTASCTIPQEKVERIEQSIGTVSQDDFRNRSLKVTIEDIKDKSNYYIVGALINDNFFDIDFEFEQFVTDTNRENTTVSADGSFFLYDDPSITNVLKIQVSNSEKILYDALRATFLNDYNQGNPFVELIIPPSNIKGENGFGVFAGFQLTEMEFNL